MTFSKALEALKQGKCLTRRAWHSTGFVYLKTGSRAINAPAADTVLGVPIDLFHAQDANTVTKMPRLGISTGGVKWHWTPNGVDLLAEDWELVVPKAMERA